MKKKAKSPHGVISYRAWIRQCTVQEFCFFLSFSFLIVNLLFKMTNCAEHLLPAPSMHTLSITTAIALIGTVLSSWLLSKLTYRMRIYQSPFSRLLFASLAFLALFPLTGMFVTKFLFAAPLFFFISMQLWSHIHTLRYRHIVLFFSILFYIMGIWFQMVSLHRIPLLAVIYPVWDALFNTMPVNWASSSLSLMSIGLTLLNGCLLIITWSPNTPCKQWNPFSAGTLMQSRRTATLAVGFSVMIFFTQLDGHSRLGFVIFLMQLALNVTITVFCHTLQDDDNTRRYVTEHILLDEQFQFSNPTAIHDKLSRVSQCIISGIERYGLREQSAHYEALLHALVLYARRIAADQSGMTEEAKTDMLRLWGVTIGFSSLPLDCRKPDDLYQYAVRLYRFTVSRNAEDNKTDDLYENILLGLLLAMIKLCDESDAWMNTFLKHQDVIVHLYRHDLVIPESKKNEYLSILLSTMSPSAVTELQKIHLFTPSSFDNSHTPRFLLDIFSGAYRSIDAVNRDIEAYDWR